MEEEGELIPTTCPPDCAGGSAGVISTIDSPSDGGNVYGGEQFAVSIGLHDRGESSVEDGIVCVTGLDADLFSGLYGCTCQSYYIELDDPDDPNFERTRIDFPSTFVSREATGDQRLTAYTRYRYTSYGIFEACLTGDPFEETACSVEGNKLVVSSSGPVEVTSITEELTPVGSNAVTLRMNVQARVNAADNEKLIALDDTSSSACVLPVETFTNVAVSLVLFGESHSCGNMKFEQGEDEAEITCRIENLDTQLFIGEQKEYQGWVQLEYGFQNIQSIQFTVLQE